MTKKNFIALADLINYHDDWNVTVLLSTGEVYVFDTEMWPEHSTGTDRDWPRVVRRAESEARDLAERHADPYCRVDLTSFPMTIDALVKASDEACERMSDEDFRRLIRQ